MRCVRPDLTYPSKRLALRASERSSWRSAGSSAFVARSSAARWTALGNTSLDDWPMLTWSLGCTPAPASDAITSLAFMFDEVPEPVWKTSIGNWSSCLPAVTSSAAAAIFSATCGSSLPSSALTVAAAPLMRPSQWMTEAGTVSLEIGKFSTAFFVSPPYSVFLGGMYGAYSSATERGQLASDTDRVVVGDEVSGAAQDPQLRVGQEVQRLLGAGERMLAVLVGPEQQRGRCDPRIGVEQLAPGVARPAPGEDCPRARELRVAADVRERVAHEVARGRVPLRAELHPCLRAERDASEMGQRPVGARHRAGSRHDPPRAQRP